MCDYICVFIKSDCTVHYLLIFFLTILPILFLKEKPKKPTTKTCMFIYIYKAHIIFIFSCNRFRYILTAVEGYQGVVVWDTSLYCADTCCCSVSMEIICSLWLALVCLLGCPRLPFYKVSSCQVGLCLDLAMWGVSWVQSSQI